ncbi:unnamed protein product [Clonostachys rosea]|uniref:Uncharacterized protein n=1 Tax=Bionectria ochroleuca TaxID=29856 RepID=A0ABY6UP39_BIOOC|nr:unnamed protein product [Clonostachys rosea]
MACYKASRNREPLSHMLFEVEKAVAHQPPEESHAHDAKIIDHLITGRDKLTIEEAQEAAEAFEFGHWLRAWILEEKDALRQNKYQQFVSAFCVLFKRSHGASYSASQRRADIIAACDSARMSAVNDINLKMAPVRTESPEEVALTEMQQRVKEHEVYIELLTQRIDSLSHDQPSQPNNLSNKGLPELLQEFPIHSALM